MVWTIQLTLYLWSIGELLHRGTRNTLIGFNEGSKYGLSESKKILNGQAFVGPIILSRGTNSYSFDNNKQRSYVD